MRRRLNLDEKRARLAGAVRVLAQRYARRAQPGADPNDRRHDKDVLRQVRRMRPEELDGLLRDD